MRVGVWLRKGWLRPTAPFMLSLRLASVLYSYTYIQNLYFMHTFTGYT